MVCLHDAAILADTVRANLFAPSAPDGELWAALEAMELGGRMLDAVGLDRWIAEDMLSLGEAQRLNLARAWLSAKPLILLDEPTEHLDAEQARRLIAPLLDRLRGKIVVIASHRHIAMEGVIELPLD
jgi:ABC-type transport system involved in cytochrome bd biosynthesis fused ATPase/permease subunit